MPTPRWMPTGGAPAGQLSRRRAIRDAAREPRPDPAARATVRFMDVPNRNPGTTDLTTVALFAFFVSLLVLVAAMLFLPAVL